MADPTSYTRPTAGEFSDYPEWASDASAAIVVPDTQKKQDGWVVERPSHQTFNWWMNNVYKWIQYLDKRGYVYDSVYDAVNGMDSSDRETAFIDTYDPTKAPLSEIWDKVGDENVLAMAADGRFVYVGYTQADGAHKIELVRPDLGAILQTYTITASPSAMHCDGEVLVVAAGNTVAAYTAPTATTTSLSLYGSWSAAYDHGAAVNAVYSDGNQIVMGGAANGSSKALSTLNRTTGALIATSAGSTISGAVSDGVNIWVSGTRDGANKTVSRFSYDLSSNNQADSVSATAEATGIAIGRNKVVACYDSGAVVAWDKRLSVKLWEQEHISEANAITIANGVVFVAGRADGAEPLDVEASIVGYDEESSRDVFYTSVGKDSGGSNEVEIKKIATDGANIYVGGEADNTGTANHTWGLYMPLKYSLIKRMAGNERYRSPLHIACVITPAKTG